MIRTSTGRLLASTLLIFGSTACEVDSGPSNHPTAPQSFLSGGSFGGYDLADDSLIAGPLPQDLSTSAVIGPDGGSLHLLDHALVVPAGAVLKPTLFTMNGLPSGYVEVVLSAEVTSFFDRLLSVGEIGFQKPVRVTLTYDRSTNIPDPVRLVLLRLDGANGGPEALPTHVDLIRKTVRADLDHSSRYAIAFPN